MTEPAENQALPAWLGSAYTPPLYNSDYEGLLLLALC